MENKELFQIAIKYIEKEYSTESLRYGDDLYSATNEERELCISYFQDIQEKGLAWAYEYFKNINIPLNKRENFVKIPLKEYIQLLKDSEMWNYLDCNGVDNWDAGISFGEWLLENDIKEVSLDEEDYKHLIIN